MIIGSMIIGGCFSSKTHKFKSTSIFGKEIKLTGNLLKPEGDGPFPAIVLLHRCGGIKQWDYDWAHTLNKWGYVAFVVDSLGPRYKSQNCESFTNPNRGDIAMDAHSAKFYLAGLSFVDSNKIAIMGWSFGASATLTAIGNDYTKFLPVEKKEPFKAAIAFYPYCNDLMSDFNAPLLILIGDKDDWTPAELCSGRMPQEKTTHEVKLKIYENTYHCFDCRGRSTTNNMGHVLRYNSNTTSDSMIMTKQFLEKYLR